MQPLAITGIGSYLPRLLHTNETLPPLDTPMSADELRRIGVERRGWAGPDEGIAEMAAAAGARALERAGVDASSIDVIVLASWTQRRYIPEFAPKLKQLLGADRAIAFDVCMACAGFLYGIGITHGLLQHAGRSRALVIGSETTSQRARPGSKATVILGDAAGAFVIERADVAAGRGGRVIDYELATDGSQHAIMDVSPEGWVRTHIEQRELNSLAGRSMANVARKILDRQGISINDVRWVVPHSGTAGVQAVVADALGADRERILTNYQWIGNVSSASIPNALDDFMSKGVIRAGDLVLSTAVGTGWYSAAALYTV